MDITYLLLKTPPYYMAAAFAVAGITIFGIIAIADRIPFRILIKNYLWLILLSIMLMISIMVWQYAAKHSGQWILVLGGTMLEILTGWWYYSSSKKEKRYNTLTGQTRGGKVLTNSFAYVSVLLILTLGGTLAWKKGMELAYGEAQITGMIVVAVLILLIAIIVGYFSYKYIDEVAVPFMSFKNISSRVFGMNKKIAHKIADHFKEPGKWHSFLKEVNIDFNPMELSMKIFDDLCEWLSNGNVSDDDWTKATIGKGITTTEMLEAQNRLVDDGFKQVISRIGYSYDSHNVNGKVSNDFIESDLSTVSSRERI